MELNDYKVALNNIIEISERMMELSLKDSCHQEKKPIMRLSDIAISPNYELIKNELVDYLKSLSDDEIKAALTIMYIGRDRMTNTRICGEELYKSELHYNEQNIPYNRNVYIEIILCKRQRGEYIRKGMKQLFGYGLDVML